MLRRLGRLYELPPKEVVRKLRRRLGGNAVQDRLAELVAPGAKTRPQMPVDFLTRYETVLGRTIGWRPLDFTGRAVIEIGAGPLFGFGPLAVFRGAARYVCVDPEGGLPVLDDPQLQARYFLPLWRDLGAVYGAGGSFEEFLGALRTRIAVAPKPLLEADIAGPFDIALSNSCLEHVFPLDGSLARLKALAGPGFRFLHLVDFGSHRRAPSPFSGMYSTEPEAYWRTHGRGINLLRAPDIQKLLQQHWPTAMVPLYPAPEGFDEPILPRWSDRYSRDELMLKVALFASA